MSVPLILVVDDDERTVETVGLYLRHAGFRVVSCADGGTALEAIEQDRPALVVLDLMLPVVDGMDVCRTIRSRTSMPVIMLTARANEEDTLRGLAIGADDYVTKPFSPRELVARVRAVLRRHGVTGIQRSGGVEIDRDKRDVRVEGRRLELTATEFELLAMLAGSPGRVYTRMQLVDHLRRADADVMERTVDAHIMNLRRKIEPDRAHPRYILTVYGVGYRGSAVPLQARRRVGIRSVRAGWGCRTDGRSAPRSAGAGPARRNARRASGGGRTRPPAVRRARHRHSRIRGGCRRSRSTHEHHGAPRGDGRFGRSPERRQP